MKLVRSNTEQPPNVVQFQCSMEMTKYDIKNYLEKIYKIPCVDVRTRIHMPKTRRDPGRGYVVKDDDIKYAYITLPKEEKFEFPNLFLDTDMKEAKEDHDKSMQQAKEGYNEFLKKNKHRRNVPAWFTM